MYATGLCVSVMCDGMYWCGAILCYQVDELMSLENGPLIAFNTLVVFVCAPYASLYDSFCRRVSFWVLCSPMIS